MHSLVATLLLAVTLAALTPNAAHAAATPGRILLKLQNAPKTDAEARASLEALDAGKELGLVLEKRTVAGWLVATVDAADEETTKVALEALGKDKAVIATDRVTTKHALRSPNDDLYSELWGFLAIDIEPTWDRTIGLASQRVGMIDSGINRDHIDLIEKDVGGFDFISDAQNAGDGNGRDADYTDSDFAGDFHGSHVAGTMIASANDGIGVPGLNWNAGLMTARALGTEGGSVIDIAEAAFWLAGGAVDGVPNIGADRVSVINMSLGADEPCGPFESDVYAAITEAGVTVVAASGNTDNFTPTGAPASCPGVIAVAAANRSFELTSYSNFDARINVVAPGGEGFVGDPFDSILSVDGSDDFSYKAIDGTSMASPHVAGVVSLMQAVNERLSPRQIKDILENSPFTCSCCENEAFLDAPSAIAQALATTGELDDTPPPPGGAGGSADCPANSTESDDGATCFCDPGFVVNAQQTGCVPSGTTGDDNDDNGGCSANSTLSPDGQLCICDPGFVVNAAQTACVEPGNEGGDGDVGENSGDNAPVACEVSLTGGDDCDEGFRCVDGFCEKRRDSDGDDDEDSDDDDDDDDDRASGCTSSGVPGSIAGFAALLALARRRRTSQKTAHLGNRTLAMLARTSVVLGGIVAATISVGCAHSGGSRAHPALRSS